MSDPLSFLAAFSSEEVMDHVLPQTTTFFSLPLELRTQIYRLCLLPKQENTQTRRQAVTVKTHMKSRVGLNLLLGCKEIYVEAVQYAYEYRWWQIGNVPVQSPQRPLDGSTPIFDGPALMASINSQTMAKIKNLSFRIPITMHGGFAASPVVLGALDSMEGLSNVRACLYFRDSSWGYATKLADSPLLIGLMIQVLTQVPEHVMLSFEQYGIGSNPDPGDGLCITPRTQLWPSKASQLPQVRFSSLCHHLERLSIWQWIAGSQNINEFNTIEEHRFGADLTGPGNDLRFPRTSPCA
ncbi:hypothetical protein D6C95_02828 [Aureobasidium pullulans]|nr:hypothetical protein D6C95_02828 [Aureobasidium pullulans]